MSDGNRSPLEELRVRIGYANTLLNYALNNSFGVSDETIQDMNKLYYAKISDDADLSAMSTSLDKIIRELTKLTYPTTIDTISYTLDTVGGKYTQILLIIATMVTVTLAMVLGVITVPEQGKDFLGVITTSHQYKDFLKIVQAITLGVLGAELSIFFYFLGLARELALGQGDLSRQVVRVVLGGVVGYIGYLIVDSTMPAHQTAEGALLLVPLFMGYSVRLFFGLLNKAIKAAEMTLGLESKADDLAQRSRQKPADG